MLGEAVATTQRQPMSGAPANVSGADASVSLVVASNALAPSSPGSQVQVFGNLDLHFPGGD